MTARIAGPALVVDAADAARIDAQLREAIRLGWLTRRLQPPHALVTFADQVHEVANQVRRSSRVNGVREPASANLAGVLPPFPQTRTLSVAQAAAVMGVTAQHVRKLARRGAIAATRAPGGKSAQWMIDTASAYAWAEDGRKAQQHTRG